MSDFMRTASFKEGKPCSSEVQRQSRIAANFCSSPVDKLGRGWARVILGFGSLGILGAAAVRRPTVAARTHQTPAQRHQGGPETAGQSLRSSPRLQALTRQPCHSRCCSACQGQSVLRTRFSCAHGPAYQVGLSNLVCHQDWDIHIVGKVGTCHGTSPGSTASSFPEDRDVCPKFNDALRVPILMRNGYS